MNTSTPTHHDELINSTSINWGYIQGVAQNSYLGDHYKMEIYLNYIYEHTYL